MSKKNFVLVIHSSKFNSGHESFIAHHEKLNQQI